MIEALTRPAWPWVAICLGAYAALIALVRAPAALVLLAPASIVCVCWWVFAGTANRWALAFLCAAILLPPLPITLGDSGPHPSLILAALGLVVGLLRTAEWRIPTGELSWALLILFFVLLASVA